MGRAGTYIFNSSEYLTRAALAKFNIHIVPANTVILSFKLTIGRVAITHEALTTNEAIAHFKTNNTFIIEYLYLYLQSFDFRQLGSTSSIATAVNSKIIKSMVFILPTEDELRAFHAIVDLLFKLIRSKTKENLCLAAIRDALLPKLMSGEIRV